MLCKNCLIWQRHLGDNKYQQLETIPQLAHIGFGDSKAVAGVYKFLGEEWKRLISISNDECPLNRCILCDKGRDNASKD